MFQSIVYKNSYVMLECCELSTCCFIRHYTDGYWNNYNYLANKTVFYRL